MKRSLLSSVLLILTPVGLGRCTTVDDDMVVSSNHETPVAPYEPHTALVRDITDIRPWKRTDEKHGEVLAPVVRQQLFLAAGHDGAFGVSDENGERWFVSSPDDTSGPFVRPDQVVGEWHNALYTGTRFLLVGSETGGAGEKTIIWESTDGFYWESVPLDGVSNKRPIAGVTLNSGLEVLISAYRAFVSYPEDPTVEQSARFSIVDSALYPDSRITALASDGKVAIAVRETDHYLKTTDGETWTQSGDGAADNELYDITYQDDRFIAVGSDHRVSLSLDGGASWSLSNKVRDGYEAHTHKCARPDTWCRIRWDGTQFVAYERGKNGYDFTPTRWASPGGIDWVGEDLFVNRVYAEGENTRETESLQKWEVSVNTGVTIGLETGKVDAQTGIGKTVQEGYAHPLYRSVDGATFEQINTQLDGDPTFTTLAIGWIHQD